ESPVRLELIAAVPGIVEVVGGELVAPVAHHPFAQLEGDTLAVRIDFTRLCERALEIVEVAVEKAVSAGLLVELDQRVHGLRDALMARPAGVVLSVEAGRGFRRRNQKRGRVAGG